MRVVWIRINSVSIPSSVVAGSLMNVGVVIENTSPVPDSIADVDVRFQFNHDGWAGEPMPADQGTQPIPMGNTATFTYSITVPTSWKTLTVSVLASTGPSDFIGADYLVTITPSTAIDISSMMSMMVVVMMVGMMTTMID